MPATLTTTAIEFLEINDRTPENNIPYYGVTWLDVRRGKDGGTVCMLKRTRAGLIARRAGNSWCSRQHAIEVYLRKQEEGKRPEALLRWIAGFAF